MCIYIYIYINIERERARCIDMYTYVAIVRAEARGEDLAAAGDSVCCYRLVDCCCLSISCSMSYCYYHHYCYHYVVCLVYCCYLSMFVLLRVMFVVGSRGNPVLGRRRRTPRCRLGGHIRGAGSEFSKRRRHQDECLSIRHRSPNGGAAEVQKLSPKNPSPTPFVR